MPSIFVWKSDRPLPSTSMYYYAGSDWFLHDSVSYRLDAQQMISHALVLQVTPMPSDWVGSDLLQKGLIPYEQIKEDAYGILDQLGTWMRYRTKREIPFERDSLEKEWRRMTDPMKDPVKDPVEEPCLIQFHYTAPRNNPRFYARPYPKKRRGFQNDGEMRIQFSRDQKE